MPMAKRENLLAVYARYTAGTESPQSFHIWSLITVVGFLMGRKTYCMPGNRQSITYPRLYTVLVAPPGARKSVAMNGAVDFVKEFELPLAPKSITKEALIEFCADNEISGEFVQISETESIELKRNDVLIASSEFSVFLREKRVSSGMVSMLNEWYDCPAPFKEKTIGRGLTEVAGVFAPILAATTADSLAQSLTQADIEGGIASRILFVVERKPLKRSAYDGKGLTPEQKRLEREIAQRLREIAEFYRGEMTLSSEAYKFYKEWYEGERFDRGIGHPRLAHYVNRKQNHFFVTSMICQAMIEPSMEIGLEAVELAVRLLESIEPNMPLAFAGVGLDERDPGMKLAPRLVAYLERYPKGVTIKELFSAFYTEIKFEDLDAAVAHLVAAKKLVRNKGLVSIAWGQGEVEKAMKEKEAKVKEKANE